jgi:hypothetical protein
MKRVYVSTADFRAPFDPIPFQGLGQDPSGDPRWHRPAPPRKWPAGVSHGGTRRTYWETALFRSPYRKGYYQDNSLFGLGAVAPGSVTVADLQRAVGAPVTGQWDAPTSAAVARKQKQIGQPETGAPDIGLLVALGLVRVDAPNVGALAAGWRDARTAFNQVPQWAYLVGGGLLFWLSWKSYQHWKKGTSATP